MKKSEEDCLKYAVCESTRAPPKREANPASLCSAAPSKGRGSRGHSLLPMEGGAPKGRRLDGGSGMKEREIVSSTPFARAPYPPLTRSPFPNGEGCDTRIPLFSTQRLSQGGKAKSAAASPRIYMGAMPEGLRISGFPFGIFQTLPICLRITKISRFA